MCPWPAWLAGWPVRRLAGWQVGQCTFLWGPPGQCARAEPPPGAHRDREPAVGPCVGQCAGARWPVCLRARIDLARDRSERMSCSALFLGRARSPPCPGRLEAMVFFFTALPVAAWRTDINLAYSGQPAPRPLLHHQGPGVSGAPLPRPAVRTQGGGSSLCTLPPPRLQLPRQWSHTALFNLVADKLKDDEQFDQVQAARAALGVAFPSSSSSGVSGAPSEDALRAIAGDLVAFNAAVEDPQPEEDLSASSSSAATVVLQDSSAPKKRKFPARKPYTRGKTDDVDNIEEDEDVLAGLEGDKFAGAGLITLRIRLQWWQSRAAARKLAPWPFDPAKIALAAALLRKGGYRSAPAYLSACKREHVRLGHPWSEAHDLEMRDCMRAVTRGLGPARQAEPFDLKAVGEIDEESNLLLPLATHPALPKQAVVFASWWLLREIELASIMVSQITLSGRVVQLDAGDFDVEGSTCGTATVDLPVSKADVRALGKRRTLRCACPSALCPLATAKFLVDQARARPSSSGVSDEFVPLIADGAGRPVTKAAVVATFKKVALAAGMAPSARITGHSPRVTGAQRMALAGISEWRIQVFGRWGGATVLRYIRDTLVDADAHHIAAEVVHIDAKPLQAIIAEAPASSSGTADLAAEALAARPAGPGETLEQLAAEYAKLRADLDFRLKAAEARTCPQFVACRSSRRAHAVANSMVTMCGWEWSASVAATFPATADWEGRWCKVCTRAASRVKGDA